MSEKKLSIVILGRKSICIFILALICLSFICGMMGYSIGNQESEQISEIEGTICPIVPSTYYPITQWGQGQPELTLLNYSMVWDPYPPMWTITTTITNVSEYIDGVTVNPNNFTVCLTENVYLTQPLNLTNNLSIPAIYTLDATFNPDVTGVRIGFFYFMDDGTQLNVSGPMWIRSETSHTIFMMIETDDSFKPGVYRINIATHWSAVGRIDD